ncbi:MAG: DinB family protein [Planctomycetota bacterium]
MTNAPALLLPEAIDLLARTPAVLDAWLRGLAPVWLGANEGPNTFSPHEVVGHLVQGERNDWIPRVQHVLDGKSEPFASFDRFAHRTELAGASTDELLDVFARERRANLDTLQSLDINEPQLELRGVHPEFGEVTLGQLLATWVVHDEGHVAQIARVLAGRYAERVGPWRAYLPILGERRSSGSGG